MIANTIAIHNLLEQRVNSVYVAPLQVDAVQVIGADQVTLAQLIQPDAEQTRYELQSGESLAIGHRPNLSTVYPLHTFQKTMITSICFCSYSIHKLLTIQHVVVFYFLGTGIIFACLFVIP